MIACFGAIRSLLPRLALILFAVSSLAMMEPGTWAEAMNVSAHGTFSTAFGDNPAPTAHDLPLVPFIMLKNPFLLRK